MGHMYGTIRVVAGLGVVSWRGAISSQNEWTLVYLVSYNISIYFVSSMTEEAMGRHDTARLEVSLIKERTYWLLKEVERKDPSGWPLPWEGLIQVGRRCIYFVSSIFSHIFLYSWWTYYWEKWGIMNGEKYFFVKYWFQCCIRNRSAERDKSQAVSVPFYYQHAGFFSIMIHSVHYWEHINY